MSKFEVLVAPDEIQLQKIRKSLGEDPERLEHQVKLLEKWVECQPHLPKNYDRSMLYYYLRGCKFDFEKAKNKFERYFVLKSSLPQYYEDRDANTKEALNVTRTVSTVVLPKMTPSGDRVSVYKLLDDDPAKFDMFEVVKFISMMADYRMSHEHPHCGDLYIFDGSNFTGAHAVKLLSTVLKTVCVVSKEAYPIRLKQIHIVNAPAMIEKVVGIVRSFMHEKMRNRFLTHNDMESVYEYIPREILPSDLGGDERSLQDLMDDWHQCFLRNATWFQKQKQVKSSGCGVAKKIYETCDVNGGGGGYGIEGSFRRLAID